MTNGWPSLSDSLSQIGRQARSAGPPGGHGFSTRTMRVGYKEAIDRPAAATQAASTDVARNDGRDSIQDLRRVSFAAGSSGQPVAGEIVDRAWESARVP